MSETALLIEIKEMLQVVLDEINAEKLTTGQAAKILGLNQTYFSNFVGPKLTRIKEGGRYLYPRHVVMAWKRRKIAG